MSTVKVMEFVAGVLRGRILTASSLSAFVAAEKAAHRLNMGAVSREAAQLAVLLPRTPVERIRDVFGEATADIVEALRLTSPYSSIALEALSLYSTSQDDQIRTDAAIAAFAAEVAVASPEFHESMAEAVDLMIGRETDLVRRGFLEELRAQLSGPDGTVPPRLL